MPDLNEIVNLIRAGKKDQARQQLMMFLSADPDNDQAWVYMAAVAKNKAEFEQSIYRALRLNPVNNQALQLAEKYDLKLPDANAIGETSQKGRRRRRVTRQQAGGGGLRRVLLMMILFVVVGAVAWFFLFNNDGTDDVIEEAADEVASETGLLATEEPADGAAELLETAEPADDDLNLATEEPLEIAQESTAEPEASPAIIPTATPEIIVATDIPETLEPTMTLEAAVMATATASPTPTIDPRDYVTVIGVQAGESLLADDLESRDAFYPNDPLNLVIALSDHADDLELAVVATSAAGTAIQAEQVIAAGAEQDVVLALDPGAAGWEIGLWSVDVIINDETVETITFTVIEPPTPTPTPTPTQTPTITPTPLPDPEIQLVWDQNSLMLLNISDEEQNVNPLEFVQDGERYDPTFLAAEWQQMGTTGTGSTFALPPGDCLQVGTDAASARVIPESCNNLRWWIPAARQKWFWIPLNDEVEMFTVFRDETPLATCEFEAGVCSFALPDAE